MDEGQMLPPSTLQVSGAEITLFVLVGSSTNDSAGYTTFRLSDGAIVSRDEAKAILERRDPPLFCAARAEEQSLSLDVRAIEEEALEPHLEQAEHRFDFLRTRIEAISGARIKNDYGHLIALSSPQGTLNITSAQLRAWLRNYFVPNHTLSIGRRAESPTLQRAVAVIRVLPAGRIWIQGPG